VETRTLQRIRTLVAELALLLEEDETPQPERPPNVTPIKADEVELTGIIGRPDFKMVKGKSLWSAGIGTSNGVGQTEWRNILAWGKLAEAAQEIQRGEVITVIARRKEESYVGNDGTLRSKTTFTVNRIVGIDIVS
jgi:hypothetical protein